MYSFEKKVDPHKDERRMVQFQRVLQYCHLVDLGFFGPWFTWERGNLLETNIKERLDRGVANEEWMKLFPKAIV